VDELLTDQQQAEVVKKWMAENGSYLIVGLILGLGVLFGWNSWKNYQNSQAEQASVIYDNLVRSVTEARMTEAEDYIRELGTNYAGTPYLAQARFLLARLHMDRNEFDEAADYLALIVADGGSSEVANIARLRLARVRHHQQRYDDALEVIAKVDSNSAFAARFHEVRGDVLLAQGDVERARAEYEAALTADEQGLIDRGFVQNKLDSLANRPVEAVADVPAEAPAANE
jgi:predicted negative regulator of RcsB-dependent stress response